MTTKIRRCCNIDWLEVHCFEPVGSPRDAAYFRRLNFVVDERPYGTRVYRQMFTVYLDGKPFVEVRRDPASQGLQGIHFPYECHLRLVNAACYLDNAALLLRQFMEAHGFEFRRISRVDICLDFEYFDSGDDPQRFLQRYLKNVYAKINQGNITAHGADRWDGQQWNSVSWGRPRSDIGTKFYNKTLELYDQSTNSYRKPYIRYAWLLCGLIDDFHNCTKTGEDGTAYVPQIWRVEFSIRSSVRKWFAIELNGKNRNYQSIQNTLDMYDSRDKLVTLFAALSNHYFHFKYLLKTYNFARDGHTDGNPVRKDRCPDKILFNFKGEQFTYKIDRTPAAKLIGDGKADVLRDNYVNVRGLDSLLRKLREYAHRKLPGEVHEACQVIIKAIEGETLRSELNHPWSNDELLALQQALSVKVHNSDIDVTMVLREIKRLLKINDNTAIF